MNCPSCGAPMKICGDQLRCEYCLTIRIPEKGDDGVRVLTAAEGNPCPVCTTCLSNARLDRTAILYCATCRGMAVPMQDFQSLIEDQRTHPHPAIPPDRSTSDLNRRLPCPACHRPMEAHFYQGGPGNVVIDTCENCLLNWLDTGELNRIAHAAHHLEPSLTNAY